MDVLVGKQGNQPFPLTESTISRQHAIVHVDTDTGQIKLRDNNSTNGTWILTNDGRFKRIVGEVVVRPETTIRLGASFICTIKKIIEKPAPTAVDISYLRDCYDEYMENKLAIESKTSNINMMRIVSMSLGSVIGILAMVLLPKDIVGDETTSKIITAGATLIVLLIAWLVISAMSKRLIKKKKENEDNFKRFYCCPKCGFHFGPKVYTNLIAEGRCPNNNCKCKFTGK